MNNKIRNELLKMMNEDQMMCRTKWDIKIHEEHIIRLKRIIRKNGWPDFELVGKEGSKAAWILVQHSDEDVEFQEQGLSLMKKSFKMGKIDLEDLAYLIDRVAKNTGKKQLYGTQFYIDSEGKYGPWPIRDVKNLNSRRKKAGLQSFSEYKRYMIKRYKAATIN